MTHEIPSSVQEAAFGFHDLLIAQEDGLARLSARLSGANGHSKNSTADPVQIDSSSGCVSAYVSAMDLVHERYWTTTYFTSGFWIVRDRRIMEANRRMLDRLRPRAGAARRLFLLDQPAESVLRTYQEHRTLLDRLGRSDDLARLDEEFANIQRNIEALESSGCELRVVHDRESTHQLLPPELAWNAQDSELAIYDDFRVDVFEGGRMGRILGLTGFSPMVAGFDELLQSAERFFETLWSCGEPMQEFLRRMVEVVEASRSKIHYRANWLARYEFSLDAEDVQLKASEASRLQELLRREGRWGQIRSYLDIGTCTGRYPLMLADAIKDHGHIVGLDDDPECLEFARGNVERDSPSDGRFRWVRADFTSRELSLPNGPFGLVTCMMSTVSHFACDRNASFDDTLQRCLVRVRSLMERSGLFVFTSWTEEACRKGRFLSIYDDLDRKRLGQWTPGIDEMCLRLVRAGFTDFRLDESDPRLCFWSCRST